MMTTMRRRDKGSGYLARKARKDGRWPASYIGSDGKRHDIYGTSKADARERLQAALRDKAAGLFVAGPSQTVAEFLTAWLKHKIASGIAPSTQTRYVGVLERHIIPAIGSIPVRKLMPQHVADLYLALSETQSPSSINNVRAVLQGISAAT